MLPRRLFSMYVINISYATERKEIIKKKKKVDSYKYEGMISITIECNDFIDTYEMIAILFIQL
jgi:hypothetical protein